MSEDRPVEDLTTVVARLQQELADLRTTLTARVARGATGDVAPTIRQTPKAETLLLQGQAVSRTTFPVLWQWVQDQSLVPSVFGVGDGTTTFVLPDLRGKTVVGATTVDPLGTTFGSATEVLVTANMPQHGHSISGSISGVGDHDHATTGAGGLHNGHTSQANVNNGAGPGGDHGHPPNWGNNNGNHTHPMTWDGAHSHGHSLSASNSGSASPTGVSVIQPSYAVNWMIWV